MSLTPFHRSSGVKLSVPEATTPRLKVVTFEARNPRFFVPRVSGDGERVLGNLSRPFPAGWENPKMVVSLVKEFGPQKGLNIQVKDL